MNVTIFVSKLLIMSFQGNVIVELEVEVRNLVWIFNQLTMKARSPNICNGDAVSSLRIEGAQCEGFKIRNI